MSAHADITTVCSVMVCVKSDLKEVKTDVTKDVSEATNPKNHVLGVRQETMSLKSDNHWIQRKLVCLKMQSDTLNENISGGRVEGQNMSNDIRLVKDDCQKNKVILTSLCSQVKSVETEVATMKSEVYKIRSDITSIKETFENMYVKLEAMKSVLIPPLLLRLGVYHMYKLML